MAVTISVAKALKLKNRLAGRMSKAESTIRQYNSTLAGQELKNIADLVKERDEIMESLVALKTTIIRANIPIQGMIIRQGELKSKIEHLNTLTTTDGAIRHAYQNTEVVHTAFLKKSDVDNMVRALEREIDALQDKLDEFNHGTKVEVDQKWLDLAS